MCYNCRNLIACDSDNLSDPYVRLYLMPERSKRKTQTQKNNLNPVYDETSVEYYTVCFIKQIVAVVD